MSDQVLLWHFGKIEVMKLSQLELIERYSKKQTNKLGPYAWSHVRRVYRICLRMAKTENENRVDLDVLEAAALLHDVGKYIEKSDPETDHGLIGARMAEDILKKCGFEMEKMKSVSHAIRAHTHAVEPNLVEARILHDADYIDKVGAVGVATILIKACLSDATIEEVLETFNSGEQGESPVAKHIGQIRKPHLYTNTARKVVARRNQTVVKFFSQLKKELELRDF
ncbi:MAG: HD domain-containing protein [Candidatus Atabeyarchaeum deiterrae]